MTEHCITMTCSHSIHLSACNTFLTPSILLVQPIVKCTIIFIGTKKHTFSGVDVKVPVYVLDKWKS